MVFRERPTGRSFYAQKDYHRAPACGMDEFIENMAYLKTIQHPNIVAIEEVNYPSLIMEYLAGEELKEMLQQGRNFYQKSTEYEIEKKLSCGKFFLHCDF